jgi:hypothetical protein
MKEAKLYYNFESILNRFGIVSRTVEEDAFSLPLLNVDVGSSAPHKTPSGESSASMNVGRESPRSKSQQNLS